MGKKRSAPPSNNARFRVYVKSGAQQRYDQLEREAADLPVQVQWDRRSADRRSASEAPGAELVGLTPRRGDRRKAPAFAFQKADFVIVEDRDDEQE